MPTPELFKYFPHDLPVLEAKFYKRDVITLTSSTVYFWCRPGGLETDYMNFNFRLGVVAVDFELFNDSVYVLATDGSITVLEIDCSGLGVDPLEDEVMMQGITPFKIVKTVKLEEEQVSGIKIAVFDGNLYTLFSNGVIAVCPLSNLSPESSTLYTVGKPKKLITFAISAKFLFVVAKADTKVFRLLPSGDLEPYGYLSRDIAKADISLRNTSQIAFNDELLAQADSQGHFALWKFDEEHHFEHQFTQWQHGSGITSIITDFDKLVGIGMDREGCGVIYSLRKSEVLERWVLHSGRVNSSELQEGRLLTTSNDETAKIWLLWK